MKRFLTAIYLVVAVSCIVWGIMWLETMRKQSAEESRQNTEAALQEADREWE
ncbi:MAG: hypothetical protein O7F73_01110 [Gammaproteobacteria bacterium]|nr:hypothetical protein [Gammaproteobacteria bacterium]